MADSHRPHRVTVEDLLRLKRAERPDPQFWQGFESELRRRQLAALVAKRPWWHRATPAWLRRGYYLPAGATAAVVLTLVAVRQYAPSPLVRNGDVPAVPVARAEVAPAAIPAGPAPAVVAVAHPAAAPAMNPPVTTPAPAAPAPAGARASVADVDSPSARSFAANLARLEQYEPDLVNAVLGSRLSPPARVQTAAVDDLADIPPSLTKRGRLLAQYNDRVASPEPAASDLVRQRLAQRLGDAEISERISRLDVRGPELSLRF